VYEGCLTPQVLSKIDKHQQEIERLFREFAQAELSGTDVAKLIRDAVTYLESHPDAHSAVQSIVQHEGRLGESFSAQLELHRKNGSAAELVSAASSATMHDRLELLRKRANLGGTDGFSLDSKSCTSVRSADKPMRGDTASLQQRLARLKSQGSSASALNLTAN
jgi:hypothetical protein